MLKQPQEVLIFFSNGTNSGFIIIVSPRFNYQVFFLKCVEPPPCQGGLKRNNGVFIILLFLL